METMVMMTCYQPVTSVPSQVCAIIMLTYSQWDLSHQTMWNSVSKVQLYLLIFIREFNKELYIHAQIVGHYFYHCKYEKFCNCCWLYDLCRKENFELKQADGVNDMQSLKNASANDVRNVVLVSCIYKSKVCTFYTTILLIFWFIFLWCF